MMGRIFVESSGSWGFLTHSFYQGYELKFYVKTLNYFTINKSYASM